MPLGDERWGRGHEVLWRRVIDGVVVLPPGADSPLELRGAAADIWSALESPLSIDELTDRLAPPRESAPGDEPAALVAELAALGIVAAGSEVR